MPQNQRDIVISWGRKDLLLIMGLCALVLAIMAPALLGFYPMIDDDIAHEWLPSMIYVSSSLAQGEIPWWDSHTFCGAVPLYLRGLSPHFLLNFPSLFLADSTSINSVYRWGIILPVALGYILIVVGTYLLGRLGFCLNRAGSAVLCLAYSLSPSVVIMFHNLYPLVAIPWFVFSITIYTRTRRVCFVALGALVFGFFTYTYVVMIIQAYVIAGIFIVVSLGYLIWLRHFKAAILLAAGFTVMLGLGFLISAPYWWSQIRTIQMVAGQYRLSLEEVAGGYRSIPPRYFASLFVPWLFDVIGDHHAWNVAREAELWLSEARLTRGLSLMFLVAIGLSGLQRSCRKIFHERWGLVAGAICSLLGLLMMSGRYLPFIYWGFDLIPVFRLPYADRWHPMLAFGLAIIIGFGVDLLITRRCKLNMKSTAVFILLVLGVVGIAICWPLETNEGLYSPGFCQLSYLGEMGWFLSGPVLYLFLVLVLLTLVSTHGCRRHASVILVILVVSELIILAVTERYISRASVSLSPNTAALAGEQWVSSAFLGAVHRPLQYPSLRFSHRLYETDPEDERYRTAFFRSILDNEAWIRGGYSFSGCVSKPLNQRFFQALNTVADGFPYELHLKRINGKLFSNMSVRDFWFPSDYRLGPEFIRVEEAERLPLCKYRRQGVLPRLFTMDRFRVMEEEDALNALLYRDLREAIIIDPVIFENMGLGEELKWEPPVLLDSKLPEESRQHFVNLQIKNMIRSTDFSSPNRVEVEVDIITPAMLVLTDVWHPDWQVEVDGVAAKLYRVNYIQQGVWLKNGFHRVVLKFRPSPIYTGGILAGLGLVGVGVLLVFYICRARLKLSLAKFVV